MILGIDRDRGLVYEGSANYGHAIWPTPLICPTDIVDDSTEYFSITNKHDISTYVFREESHDLASRVRKGRLYWRSDFPQPSRWYLSPHPSILDEPQNMYGKVEKDLFNYTPFDFQSELNRRKIINPLVLIGSVESYTIWTVNDVETTITGSQILLLRSRLVIRALPKILSEKIPEHSKKTILKFLELLSKELYMAGPSSIVDRSREALSAILSAYLQEIGIPEPGHDLTKLAGLVEKNDKDKVVIYSLCKSVARLHTRGKSSVQKKNPEIREIHERDAELAVQCVGTVLCDLGWAEW